MIENAEKLGKVFLQNLKSIFNSSRVRDVRGKGLFVGVEFQDK
jgi:acetylornithine/succinyldiaminopimelate/putrescine aminotransferase